MGVCTRWRSDQNGPSAPPLSLVHYTIFTFILLRFIVAFHVCPLVVACLLTQWPGWTPLGFASLLPQLFLVISELVLGAAYVSMQ